MNEKNAVILILEDEPYLLRQLKDFFEDEGFEVIDCVSIFEGMECWDNNKSRIDIILTDTNMSPNGLTEEEIKISDNGCLSGWIWIKNYVLNDQKRLFQIERIFILSDYIPILERFVSNNKEWGFKELERMKNKRLLFDKGDPEGSTAKVINAVKKELSIK